MKIEKDHAIIEAAEEAAVFGPTVVGWFHECDEAQIGRGAFLKAITPKEGDAVFWWDDPMPGDEGDGHADGSNPEYCRAIDFDDFSPRGEVIVKANALTIGKTVGELRALLVWCEEGR
jgi:hypothetical protein